MGIGSEHRALAVLHWLAARMAQVPLLRIVLPLLVVAGMYPSTQVGRIWTSEELLKESQVAVIANVVRSADTRCSPGA